MQTINQQLFLFINSYAGKNHFLDITGISLGEFMPYLFIIAEVYIYFIKKEKIEAILAFEATLLGLFTNQIIGHLYLHNRPFVDGLGVLLHKHLPDNSFPSDHTTFMLSIAFSLLFYKKSRRFGTILVILGIIGGFARVYEGVHYPFDIIGGIITGFVGAILIYVFKMKLGCLNNSIISVINKMENTLK